MFKLRGGGGKGKVEKYRKIVQISDAAECHRIKEFRSLLPFWSWFNFYKKKPRPFHA